MKKLSALILCLAMLLCLCACGTLEPKELQYEGLTGMISPAFNYSEEYGCWTMGDAAIYFDLYTEGEIKSNEVYFTTREYCDVLIDDIGVDASVMVDRESGVTYCTFNAESESIEGEMIEYTYLIFVYAKQGDNFCDYYTVECSAPADEFAKYEPEFWSFAKSITIG